MTESLNIGARRQARHRIIQVLYQQHHTDTPINEIVIQRLEEDETHEVDREFFDAAIVRITTDNDHWNALVEPLIDRDLAEVGAIEMAILRLALYELTERMDVPHKVAIDEAIELAKRLGAPNSHAFINGSLDKWLKQQT